MSSMIKKEMRRIFRLRKPNYCPRCGQKPMASILYGYPVTSDKLEQQIKDCFVCLGGCMHDPIDDPRWKCTRCGLLIYKRFDDLLFAEGEEKDSKVYCYAEEKVKAVISNYTGIAIERLELDLSFHIGYGEMHRLYGIPDAYIDNPDIIGVVFKDVDDFKIGAEDMVFFDLRDNKVVGEFVVGE